MRLPVGLVAALVAGLLSLVPAPAEAGAGAPPAGRVSEWHRFVGMNIRGTPAMRADQVAGDLAAGQSASDVLVAQEFRWPWYWRTAARSPRAGVWRSSPGYTYATAHPVFAGQPVLWDGSLWERRATDVSLAHPGAAGISEDRHVRAVRLRDRDSRLAVWFLSTHFVVGGDQAGDSARRRQLLATDLHALDTTLTRLRRSGHGVIAQLDANIRPGGWAYPVLLRVLARHGARLHGTHGVEYLFTVDGPRSRVQVRRDWVIGTHRLATDHEARGISFRLRR